MKYFKSPEEYYYDRNKKLWLPRVVRMEMLHNAKTLKNQWTADIHKGTKELSYTPASYYWDIEVQFQKHCQHIYIY